jgi:glycosyltransferase involved in cell wall biosynthesis
VTRSTIAVVPAFDAERSVGSVVRDLRSLWAADGGSVIVVDDGSADRTAEAAREAGATVVRHRENLGKGAALRTGFAEALRLGATHAVTVDADGQHPAVEARRLAEHPAPEDHLGLAIRDLVRDGAPGANQFSNAISNFFLSWFSGRRLDDTQCGLRRYPIARTLRLDARDDGYAFEAEVVLRATRSGWGITQIPVRVYYPPESERVTHFHVVRDPARIVRRVVVTLYDTRVRRPRGVEP